jgi:hypothetical protein
LVAHLLWEQRVAGSNPAAPTSQKRRSKLGLKEQVKSGEVSVEEALELSNGWSKYIRNWLVRKKKGGMETPSKSSSKKKKRKKKRGYNFNID